VFARPTLSELISRVRGDIRGRLEIENPLLRRAMADALGAVWGGAVHTLHGFLEWLSRQFFGDTAEEEALYRRAEMHGITPTPATFASGTVTATGTNGEAIPIDTIIRLDDEVSYRVTAGQVIAGGVATVPITAVLAGSASNVPATTELTFESPLAGVDATVTVDADIENGEDEETVEEVRDNYLSRLREPPEGGADHDYVAWAKSVAGVTRAWAYENELGLGTVVVRFVCDNDEDIFPDVGTIAAVQAKFDEERPMCAVPTAAAPTPLEVDFELTVTPDTAEVRAAVEAELADLLEREGEAGDGDGRGTILLSKIRTAIGIADGVEDYTLTVPAADVVPAVGELPVLGTVTWPP
jgi:uncharacterized phage protein gp47/JayE